MFMRTMLLYREHTSVYVREDLYGIEVNSKLISTAPTSYSLLEQQKFVFWKDCVTGYITVQQVRSSRKKGKNKRSKAKNYFSCISCKSHN